MSPRAALALLVCGCGAALGGDGAESDAGIDARPRDGAIDAPVDARPCMGGNAAQVAPDGSCLVHVTMPVTFEAARAACVAMNAHLAYLKDAALDTFAETFIGPVDTWIGGSDRLIEGTFVWDDGTAFAFTHWGANEPNNGGGVYQEDCVIIAGSRADKAWDDRPCDGSEVPTSGRFAYLCQY